MSSGVCPALLEPHYRHWRLDYLWRSERQLKGVVGWARRDMNWGFGNDVGTSGRCETHSIREGGCNRRVSCRRACAGVANCSVALSKAGWSVREGVNQCVRPCKRYGSHGDHCRPEVIRLGGPGALDTFLLQSSMTPFLSFAQWLLHSLAIRYCQYQCHHFLADAFANLLNFFMARNE